MDSGSSPNVVTVTEAKTKPTVSSSSFPTPQIQPPITVMMQQAIAMQQFQFQQALLMQQVMASQQAAARAATVKSAAEMAAARAAEISKQLKGSDVEEENEKTADRSASRSKSRSSSRSQSRSRSRSRSHSRSQSRSRSPIRYRRDRSLSGSPIRYRRDRYSPSRYRDYYGYHNRSRSRYRGYYRGGRGDYSWSYYRREWDRDRGRDYLSHVARRSRSRSRVRRRSRTRSQSPKYRRDHSLSPRHHREERSAGRRSKRSRSRETKHSRSSRSLSVSRESGSLRKENKALLKGSLTSKPKVGDDSDHLEVHSDSIDNERSLSQKSSLHSSRAERKEKVNSIKHDKVSDSPVRSFSVSLDPSSRIGKEHFDEDVNSTRYNRKLSHQHKRDVDIEGDELSLSTEEQVHDRMSLQPKTASSDGLTSGVNGHNRGDTSLSFSKEYQREPAGRLEKVKRREQTEIVESSEDEMEDGKELDDWRDDIKAYEKEKAMRKESRKEAAKKEDDLIVEGVRLNSKSHKESSFQQYTNTSLDETNDNGKEMHQVASEGIEVSQDLNCEGIDDIGSLSDVKNSSHNNNYAAEEVGDRDIRHVPYPLVKSIHPVDKIGRNDSEENAYVSYNSDGGSKDANSHESAYEDREADLIYEGPVIAANEDVYSLQQKSPKLMDAEYKLDNFHNHDSTRQYKTSSGRDTLEEQSKHIKEAADAHVSRKRRGRERSAAKEDLKRIDEEHEKRKDRHKKHKRKHRRETSTEQDGDDYSNMDGEGRRGKKRHRRKHRKDDEDRKERKKRRHKHRVKAISCSRSQSLSLDDKHKVEIGTSTAYRKSSSRQKKRRKETSKSPSHSFLE
ncbi:hypothetical protein O6H91_10G059600 [Diphasiastrum complanatum]|uniref:Uncharacterized protein n=1 Tax=Diphasiastrum complanatum TaxID=34168 RepID=A0ACC2CIE9_DIPCM|nr:hypothetical protein O6H91_10G059600 [Diphasiastrum complanatum]